MIKVGIIGCGYMGQMHATCYQFLEELGVKVTAVADAREDFARTLAEQLGATYYTDGFALITEADVDAVDICLPTYMHTSHAVAAMKTGKHVFVEKPVCVTDDDIDLMLKTKKETSVQVQVGQVVRMWPEYMWLKEQKEANSFGRLLCGTFHRLSAKPMWASNGWLHNLEYSGGMSIDLHIHDVDFVRYLLGDPNEVKVQAYRDADGLIQQIYALYGYDNNTVVSLEAGWNYPASFPFDAGYRIIFEHASVVFSNNELTVYPNHGEPYAPKLPKYTSDNLHLSGNISSLGGYYNELRYFIEGLRGDHSLEIATLEDAVASVRLVKREVELAGGFIQK